MKGIQGKEYWINRPLNDPEHDWGEDSPNWAEGYLSWESVIHPHRKLIVDSLRVFEPLRSILEVGCNAGPNLYRISQKYTSSSLYFGCDVNEDVIRIARENFGAYVTFNVSSALDVPKLYKENSMDVLLTDAVLIYVNPTEIEETLRGFDRVVRKGMIFVERYDYKSELGVFNNSWNRNYEKLLTKMGYKWLNRNSERNFGLPARTGRNMDIYS